MRHKACHLPQADCNQPFRFNKIVYKQRRRIENAFCRLKVFRCITTPYDKLARNFLASIGLAAAPPCLPRNYLENEPFRLSYVVSGSPGIANL